MLTCKSEVLSCPTDSDYHTEHTLSTVMPIHHALPFHSAIHFKTGLVYRHKRHRGPFFIITLAILPKPPGVL